MPHGPVQRDHPGHRPGGARLGRDLDEPAAAGALHPVREATGVLLVEDRERVLDPHSGRCMIRIGTAPSVGWSNAAGTAPTTVKPSELHSRTAPALLATTALNCMAR